MGSIPLPALDIKSPNIEPYDQMQANALNQRLGQADLRTKNLQNQQLQTILRGNQSIVAAQHDPNWDPSDPDQVVKLFKQYNVPLDLQASGMKFITDMKQSMMNQTKESLTASADAHAQFDDQLQAVRDAPVDSQQKAYQQALSNARDFVSRYPNGPAKAQAMQEISSAPPIYDENWVRSQHAQLRTQQFLTEDALKKSQASEAAGKGAQATAESNLFAAQTPGAQAQSGIEQIKLGMMQGGKIENVESGIDQMVPQSDPANNQYKVMARLAMRTGGIDAAMKVVDQLGTYLSSIQKDTNPAVIAAKKQEGINTAQTGQNITQAYRPVLAYDKNDKAHLLPQDDAKAAGYTGITQASDKEIDDAKTHNTTLNDMQPKLNDVVSARKALDQGPDQRAIISRSLAHMEPGMFNDWMASLAMKNATQLTRDYVISVNSLKESALGLPKEITNTARQSELQGNALFNTLPSGSSVDSKYALQQAQKFQANIDRMRQRVPIIRGMTAEAPHPDLSGKSSNMGGPPAGATGKAKGSDGKFHWTDGKRDLGVAE